MSQADYRYRACWRFVWILSVGFLFFGTAALAQERPVIGEGEVSAGDVYVRSGASLSHYTVCKLNAGDRVAIVGERGEWYEILPPNDAFSLISGEYVDTADNKTGVVNGDNVRVRAGSSLNDNKYTVQLLLPKGASVSILGRDPNGFLRIVPPTGATLWISRQLVELVPDELAALERSSDASESAGSEGETPVREPEPPATPAVATTDRVTHSMTVAEPSSPLEALPPTDQRGELEQIDIAAKAELTKPLSQRQFEEVLKQYRAIAGQKEDVLARQYAELRIEQVNRMIELSNSVRKVQEFGERTEARRREFLSERMLLPDVSPPLASGLDAQGELRVSALYPPGRIPRRYRLVDVGAGQSGERTIGYVEIPQNSTIDAQGYLGRYVGVRASKTRLQADGVDPIPIYEVSELVLVQPRDAAAGRSRPE